MLSSSDYYPVTPYQKNFVKIGKCQDVVRNHPRTMEAAAEKADGPTTPECSQRQLRPPREAHTLQDSYCHRADSVLDYPQESDSPPRASRDPEKASSYHQHTQYYQNITYRTSSAKTDEDMGEYDEEGVGPKRTALWILFYLSALAPLVALPMAIYTLLTTILLLLLSPILFLLELRPLRAHFYRLLAPSPRFQLRLISSSHDIRFTKLYTARSAAILVLANTFAPLYAVAIAAFAWVGGVFWFYTAILGNPDGKEERDDGREFVLTVSGWWEKWLVQGLR